MMWRQQSQPLLQQVYAVADLADDIFK